jgi:histidinol phosphatase-like enzyme (inositol monophosphatase family)
LASPPAGPGPPVDRALVAEAVDLARRAGELSLHWFQQGDLQVDRKGDGTPVTEADRAVERFLRSELVREHPDDGIVGEEEEPRASASGRTWIIDPIDGTKAFTRGVPLFANLLAVEDRHGAAVGVINIPALGEMVWAGRGRGCLWNGQPAHVSDSPALAGAYVSSSAYDGWDDAALLAVKRAGAVLRTWGDGYGYLLVATGRIDAMVDPAAERYDLAPMPVILAEAGGCFTDYSGRVTATGGSAVATNGHLHHSLLACLAPPG